MISNLQTDYQSAVDFLRKDALSNPKVSELSPPLREASVFRRLLEQIPIGKFPAKNLQVIMECIFLILNFQQKLNP